MPPVTKYPMVDLQSEVSELWSELSPAVERVLRSGQFIGGTEVEAFEREVAGFLGARHVLGLNSGTDALLLGLEALGVGPGDEVVTSPFSFFATSEAILRLGAKPVFVDVDEETLNLSPALLEEALTERTRVVLPVHIFGLPADMGAIMRVVERHRLPVLEDCAQAFGARVGGRSVGSIGVLGAFSLYPTKNLGAYGDGGLVTTESDELAARLRSLRNHGSTPQEKYLHEGLGYNSRLDALQAGILRVKLRRLEAWQARRLERVAAYRAALADLPGGDDGLMLPPDRPEHRYHQFTLRLPPERRVRFEDGLRGRGVAFTRFYPIPLTRQPMGANFGAAPVAEKACERVVSVPIHPWLPDEAIAAVAEAARAAFD
ncbi:MAG: DegT/DnrJ/EryC1/StrS family aminotransferase [Trueperaceae bacterium]|nr:DegT/DnrJ/EryC1/StrS family aminotransferase [Trueperaceae bacterium]MCO5174295.1 DegT/DnrJ/EryC1/StrS family aminotransferase [Trueperaceae bacterium]MCW5820724.1 DegT/DnrJ/EryC1/StrS family aminotransferase [Trueperaceae bacterium]